MSAHDSPERSAEVRNTLEDLRLILRRRRLVILAFTASVVAAAGLYSALKTPVYSARGSLWIEKEPNVLPFDEVFQIETRNVDYLQSHYKLLLSQSLAAKTIEDRKLYLDPRFAGPPPVRKGKPDPADSGFRRELVDRFLARLSVAPVRDTRIVEVRFEDRDPRFAAAVLDGLFESYIDLNTDRRLGAAEQAQQFLTLQIEAVRKEIEAQERDLQKYEEAKNIVTLTGNETSVLGRLSDVSRALNEATLDRIQKQETFNQIRTADPADIPAAVTNPLIQRLREEYARQSREYAKRLEVVKPEYPEMQRLQTEMQVTRQSLAAEIANLVRAAGSEYQSALKRERTLAGVFEEQKKAAFALDSDSISYNSRKIELENKKTLIGQLLKRQSEADVSARLKGFTASNVWIVDRPLVPRRPSSPRTRLNLALALVLGLAGGIGLGFLFEFMGSTVRTSRDVTRYLGVPTLGIVPSFKSGVSRRIEREAGRAGGAPPAGRPAPPPKGGGDDRRRIDLIVQREPMSFQAESYRSIRTSFLAVAPSDRVRTVLFTSPLPREGKSSTISNLAVAVAQGGKKVVVIDADLRRPRLTRLFGLNGDGLTRYLASTVELAAVVRPTDVPNLSVVGSGPVPSNPLELLTSRRMSDLIDALKARFDYVLIDTPPVFVVSDAVALGPVVDAVVLVAFGGQTPIQALRQAKQKLDAHRIACLGVILNGAEVVEREVYYARSYHRYYGRS